MSSSEASLDDKNNAEKLSDSEKYGVEPTDTLYIENISNYQDGGTIKKIFSSYGQLIDVIKDQDTAYVRFEKVEHAKSAHDDDQLHPLGIFAKVTYAKYGWYGEQPTVVYLKNLPDKIKVNDLHIYFSSYGKINHIELVDNCCSIRYADSCDAVAAFRANFGKLFIHTDVDISMQHSKKYSLSTTLTHSSDDTDS